MRGTRALRVGEAHANYAYVAAGRTLGSADGKHSWNPMRNDPHNASHAGDEHKKKGGQDHAARRALHRGKPTFALSAKERTHGNRARWAS